MTPGAFDRLVALLKRLPGIGEKSARRMAFFFIQQPQAFASDFIEALNDAKRNIRQCSLCGTITDTDPCPICSDPMRDRTSVLVVETVEDLVNIEGTGVFGGVYHVLGERVSPLTGDDLSGLGVAEERGELVLADAAAEGFRGLSKAGGAEHFRQEGRFELHRHRPQRGVAVGAAARLVDRGGNGGCHLHGSSFRRGAVGPFLALIAVNVW